MTFPVVLHILEIAKKTKGQLSQIDDLRGVEATMSVYRKRIANDLANAFYILNESENPSKDSIVGENNKTKTLKKNGHCHQLLWFF